jgi:hypothetical protein
MLESPVWSPCSITEECKDTLPLGLLAQLKRIDGLDR